MTATMQTVLLDVDDVARELNVEQLAVLRIIAKGVLPATQTGAGDFAGWTVRPEPRESPSRWRITPDALSAYVSRGAPDLQMPVRQVGSFRDRALERETEEFVGLMNAAAQPQVSMEALRREFEKRQSEVGIMRMHEEGWFAPRKLSITASMRAIMDSPRPKPEGFLAGPWDAPAYPQASPDPFSNRLDGAIVAWLRSSAEMELRSTVGVSAGLSDFYSSPAMYSMHSRAAFAELLEQPKVWVQAAEPLGPSRSIVYWQIRTRDLLGIPEDGFGSGKIFAKYADWAF